MVKWVFLILMAAEIGYGANFPTGTQIEILNDFSGGLNTTSPKHKIGKNYSPSMSNVLIHRRPGSIIKRSGFILAGSTSTLMNGRFMFTFNKENGDKEFIVSDDSQVLTTKDFQTYTFISSGLNNSVHLNACQVRNKVWFTNGIDSVFTWDGVTKQILDGTNSTPLVPKFRYFTYYQERVFGGNTAGNGALLQWTDVASTAGIAIAPDSFLAWPVLNGLNIGQGDGTVITSLWLYKSQLQIGKERSVYTLYGTNSATYFARKTESQAGVSSNESVVVLDGLTYYKGFDGIYAYDGGSAKRISDTIVPDIVAMLDSVNLIKENSWDTQAEFGRGAFSGSTVTADGFLQPEIALYNIVGQGWFGPQTDFSPLTASNTFYGFSRINFGNQISSSSILYLNQIKFNSIIAPQDAQDHQSVRMIVRNLRTNEDHQVFFNPAGGTVSNQVFFTTAQAPLFQGFDINQGSFAIKFQLVSDTVAIQGGGCSCINLGNQASWTFGLQPATTGQFISDVATNTTITAWGAFDSISNTNGSINFYERTSTSVVNITTQAWKTIIPGSILNEPTQNTFVQWAATITSISSFTSVTNIDNVTIAHIEGAGNRDRPFAIDWKNEYWLSVATETSGNFSLQYVKSWITNSVPNAWNYLQGMNIRSFTKNGTSSLYGGSASTGAFYRLDYGTNDNGRAIDGFYETPELVLKGGLFGGFEGNWMDESLHELWIDADAENGNTFRLGSSFNGSSYTEDTFSLNGTNRILQVLYTANKYAKYFQWRFRNNDLDKGLGLNNFAVIYIPQSTR